jgi:hypothetical protein
MMPIDLIVLAGRGKLEAVRPVVKGIALVRIF